MKCKHCGEKFSLPVDNAPGIFLAVGLFFIVAGLTLWALEVRIWPYFLGGVGGFIALQAEVNRGDFNRGLSEGISRTKCPKCKEIVIVKLWSM
jgi:hypothetical protein